MQYWELPEQAQALSQKTLDLLARHSIPATPHNYELCFMYSVNQTPELSKAFGALLERDCAPRPEELSQLHEKFCQKNSENDTVADVGGRMQDELKKLAALLENTGHDTAAYAKTLNAFAVQSD